MFSATKIQKKLRKSLGEAIKVAANGESMKIVSVFSYG